MSNRPATVAQADVQRVIRACQKTGLAIQRIVVRPDGVSIEAVDDVGNGQTVEVTTEERIEVVL